MEIKIYYFLNILFYYWLTTVHDIYTLQLFVTSSFALRHATTYLQSKNIPESYVKLYLSVQIFTKIPDMYDNISNEFREIIVLINDNINL